MGLSRSPSQVTIDPKDYDAFVFDMDGVVTDTASLHEHVWRHLFDRYVLGPGIAGRSQAPFGSEDYRRYVDGRSRVDGIASFLASRGIQLPPGHPDDPVTRHTVWGLANRKNELFNDAVGDAGVAVFESTTRFVERLRAHGLRTAVVTASRNAAKVLAAGGVADLFDVRVDGVDVEDLGLAGKPDPASFLEAVRRLGVDQARAAVVEDAVAGVEAARRGGFALVIGLDRSGGGPTLLDHGAHVVVSDLADIVLLTPSTGGA